MNSASTSTPIQSISITKVTSDPNPTPHLVYHIQISLPVKSWLVQKRYSDFISLDSKLQSLSSRLPVTLPPKHSTRSLFHSISTFGGLIPNSTSSAFLDVNSKDQNQLNLIRERKFGLEAYLRALLSCSDRIWRESSHFKQFLKVDENVTLARNGDSSSSNSNPPVRQPPSEAVQRITQRQQQSQTSASTSSTNPTPFVRTLGKPSLQYQETDRTRHLDDGDLFQSQKDQFDQQDAQLDSLAQILRRQKQLGLTMNQELAEQNELLATLDQEVDSTQNKMKLAESKMSRLENK